MAQKLENIWDCCTNWMLLIATKYSVSQKNILNIFDCKFNKDYQI